MSDEPEYTKITQEELDEIVRLHERYSKGLQGGSPAVLKFYDLSDLSLFGKNLSNADFTAAIMINCDLSEGIFDNANFYAADMRLANMHKASLKRADFRGAYVAGANLTNADLTKADMREGKMMSRDPRSGRMVETKLAKDFDHPMIHADFSGARFEKTNLNGVKAVGTNFSETDMSGVQLTDSDLRNAQFKGSNLSGADMAGCDLRKADMDNSILTGAKLEHTEVHEAKMENVIKDEDEDILDLTETLDSFDDMMRDHAKWLETLTRDGKQMDLSEYDMRKVEDFKKGVLSAVKANKTIFIGLDLSESIIQFAQLQESDFRDCDLHESSLNGSDFSQSKLTRANLEGADLSPMKIPGKNGVKAKTLKTRFKSADLRYGRLMKSNLKDTDFSDADLSYADLTGADLTGADLTNTKLSGAVIVDTKIDKIIGIDDINKAIEAS